jgi:aminomethyltransferase
MNNQQVIISRTGYTGEDGFEIYAPNDFIGFIWDQAIKLNTVPCGLGARDTLRFQANLPLYGHEISNTIHPYVSGLKFAINFDKEFIGNTALLKDISHLDKKIVGVELLEKNIPRQGYKLYKDQKEIGYITTGYLLPEIDTPLALALVDKDESSLSNDIEVEIRKKRIPAKIRNRKFLNKNYVK